MSYLPYISDNDLRSAVKTVVDCIFATQKQEESKMYKNVIDPFSAIFDGVVLELSLKDWLKTEKARQVQKTVQNKIGEFHQNILGSLPGWENLGRGKIVDIRNTDRKIVAEIKNKHNTTKGDFQAGVYNKLATVLSRPEYQRFTAYYVLIIPKTKKFTDKPFTPSDNETGTRKSPNEMIRQISGKEFYALATGVSEALSMLFDILPDVISEVAGVSNFSEQQKADFRSLFDRAY